MFLLIPGGGKMGGRPATHARRTDHEQQFAAEDPETMVPRALAEGRGRLARSFDAARTYARIVAVAYGLLTVMGLMPGLNTMFGLVPIHGHDVRLHALIAAAGAYFGFTRGRDRAGDSASPVA